MQRNRAGPDADAAGHRLTPGGLTDTLFHAFAVIDWMPERGYFMRSNVADGRVGEFPITVTDSGFVWGFEVPGGRVRYTMALNALGEWHEKGEFSRDGAQWFPTMEMRLKRNPTDKPTP